MTDKEEGTETPRCGNCAHAEECDMRSPDTCDHWFPDMDVFRTEET